MIHYVVAVHDREVYKEWTEKSLEKFKDSVVIEVDDEPGDSIFKKYNRGIDRINLEKDDLVAFIHEDVKILDPHFEEKIKMTFQMKPETGILGVIGSFEYGGFGWWHVDRDKHFGQIEQGLSNGKSYRMIKKVGFSKDMVVVDGCFMVFSAKFLKDYRFDEERFPGAYHFYDVDSCLTCLKMGFDVACADILIHHKSEGPMGDKWEEARGRLNIKWRENGLNFPVTKGAFE